MENVGISPDQGIHIISTTTSGGRSGHLRMLAAAMAASAAMAPVREEDPDQRDVNLFGGLSYKTSGSGWQYGQKRTSGQGVPGVAKARKLRKTKKKMRQQSRKK